MVSVSPVRELSDDLIDTLVDRFPACPAPLGQILVEHFHGAVTRVDPAATAVPHRRPGYNMVLPTQWLDPAATEASIAWTRETFAAITPHRADGRWLNYYDADEDASALAAAYGGNETRLVEIKRQYDAPATCSTKTRTSSRRARHRFPGSPDHRRSGGTAGTCESMQKAQRRCGSRPGDEDDFDTGRRGCSATALRWCSPTRDRAVEWRPNNPDTSRR